MSGGKKQSQTTTSEIKLPEWINQAGQSTFQSAQQAAAANPITAYGGPMAAGSNQQLDAAGQMALQNQGVGTGDLDRARQLTDEAAAASGGRVSTQDFDSAQASRYMSPYQEQVQQRTLDMMMRQGQRQLNELGDNAQMQKAFGGDRHGIAEGKLMGEQNMNMLDYLARSNAEGYNDAYSKFAGDRSSRQGAEGQNAGLDQSEIARRMAAGGQFGQIGGQASAMNQQDVDTLLRSGLIDQDTANQMLGADYQEFLRMQDAPMLRYQQLMGLLSGTPSNRSQTDTTVSRSGGGLFNTLMGAGMTAASVFSDRRLKRNIQRIRDGWYRFQYLWSDDVHEGVMADEVPAIAKTRMFGFDVVDYSKLGAVT